MPSPENEVSQDSIVAKPRRKKSRQDELLDELLAEYGGSAETEADNDLKR